MPLESANLSVEWTWAFAREEPPFLSPTQGPESRSASLDDLDVSAFTEAICLEADLLPSASVTIDLFSFTDLLYLATGLTTALALAINVPFVEAGAGAGGPVNAAGLGADNAAVGDVAWTNPTNVYTSNNVYATSALTAGQTTHRLDCTTFGFAVPTTATVTGITVSVERKSSVSNDTADTTVQLLKAGAAAGSNKASATKWPTSDGVATYGGAADLWGTTLSPADVNAAGFGVTLRANAVAGSTASIDQVTVTVHFTDPRRGLVLSPGASNGLTWMFEDPSDKLWIPVGGFMAWSDYVGGSGTLVDATHRNLTILNRSGETLTPQIFILGGA